MTKYFNWKKGKHVFKPDGTLPWMVTHAQVPTPIEYSDKIRIFYTTRPAPIDNLYESRISYIDVDSKALDRIKYIHDKPVLALGDPGTFDQYGTMPACFIKREDCLLMYYTGWNRFTGVPYSSSIGLAISKDKGNTFHRISKGPILGIDICDPFLVNGPWIIIQNDLWHMWYSSGKKWIKNDGQFEIIYLIKHATSLDGMEWKRTTDYCIPSQENECQNAPTVFYYNGQYHMLFCHRQAVNFRNPENGYKMGYAFSSDLITWQRDDTRLKFERLENSWDSEMMCYPRHLSINDTNYIFYCGNQFGKFGFGVSELEADS